MRLIWIAMFFIATSAQAKLVVSVTEQSTGKVITNLVDVSSRQVELSSVGSGQPLPQIQTFEIKDRRLIYASHPIGAADELLYQCSSDGTDIAIVREEYNSLSNPLRVLFAISGHPTQVSKIKLVVVRLGRLEWQKELTRKPSSYGWDASVSH